MSYSNTPEDCQRRFIQLMGEDDAWVMPCLSVIAAEPAPIIQSSRKPAPRKEEVDDYDEDDPEQVCNARFAPKPSKERRHVKPSSAVTAIPTQQMPANENLLKNLKGKEFRQLGLHVGDLPPISMTFSPWKLVQDYPFMFIGRANFEKSYPCFSMDSLFENVSWDFFYLHHPTESFRSPYIFVPTDQFKHLLDIVNCRLSIQLRIPDGKNEEKFRLEFGESGTPRPRYLGRAGSVTAYEGLIDGVPDPVSADSLDGVSSLARDHFLNSLQAVNKASASKRKKNDPAQALAKRVAKLKSWGRMTKRVQRYLGQRQKNHTVEGPVELERHIPCLFTREGDVVFIAIDVEAYEKNNKLITEIGLAILDTRFLLELPPKAGGEGWFPLIRARHFRVKENMWAVNNQYVVGCPDSFNFGTSEIIKLDDVAATIEQIVGTLRRIALVFHDSSQDISYLDQIGYDVMGAERVVEIIDTQLIHQHHRRRPNPASLQAVLNDLGIPSRDLHNAGNDAVYTLQAMICIAIRRRQESLQKNRSEVSKAVPEKSEPTQDYYLGTENDGWETGGEDSDGGDPERSDEVKVQTLEPKPSEGMQPA